MKAYSFATFLVDDSNRHAYDLCHDISKLRPSMPMPLILLGEKGSGKTHLLYSIVNKVRSSSAKTGLAYVTAGDFPSQVRALIEDPSPVERSESAILLVNHLEGFIEHIEELEAIVQIFLDQGHKVVLASSLHPSRLHNLTSGLRKIITNGQLSEVQVKSPEALRQFLKKESGDTKETKEKKDKVADIQAKRIEELENLIESAKELKLPDNNREDISILEEKLKGERKDKEAVVNYYEGELSKLREELNRQDTSRGAESKELESLRAEVSLLAVDAKESKQLRRAYDSMKERADKLSAQLDELKGKSPDREDLNRKLEAARDESRSATAQANELLMRAQTLIDLIESNKREFYKREKALLEQVTDLEKEIESLSQPNERSQNIFKLRADFDIERQSLQKELKKLQDELSHSAYDHNQLKQALKESKRERDELRVAMDKAEEEIRSLASSTAYDEELEALRLEIDGKIAEANVRATRSEELRHEAILERSRLKLTVEEAMHKQAAMSSALEKTQAELVKAQKAIAHYEKEMDSVRNEAARQTAEANIQAGHLKGELSKLNSTLDLTRQTGHVVGSELNCLEEQLREVTDMIGKLAQRITTSTELSINPEYLENDFITDGTIDTSSMSIVESSLLQKKRVNSESETAEPAQGEQRITASTDSKKASTNSSIQTIKFGGTSSKRTSDTLPPLKSGTQGFSSFGDEMDHSI